MGRAKVIAWHLYHSVVGGGADFLVHKREYHRRRQTAERGLIERSTREPELFRPSVCPACGAPADAGAERLRNPVGFQFAVCSEDGTLFMDPLPVDEAVVELNNDPAEAYQWQADRAGAAERVRPKDQEDFAALVRLLVPGDRRPRLLDVGCATGGFLLTASERFEVKGVEINDDTARVARANGLDVVTGDLSALGGEERFDVVTMLQVIEHIPRPEELLRQIQRVLTPGGLLYLNTPNIDSASFRYLKDRHMHVSSGGHVSLFTKRGLYRLAARCGYEVAVHEYCGGRDLALHDLLTHRWTPRRFSHRMAAYSPRLWHATRFLELLSAGLLDGWLYPAGHASYQRALLRPVQEEG